MAVQHARRQPLEHDDGYAQAVEAVHAGLTGRQGVHADLPGGGRLYFERPLPHLLVHARSRDGDRLSDRLVTPLPPYVIVPADVDGAALGRFVTLLVKALAAHCGHVLVIELGEKRVAAPRRPKETTPVFQIVSDETRAPAHVVKELEAHLQKLQVLGQASIVDVQRVTGDELSEPARVVLAAPELDGRCSWIQLNVSPIYRDRTSHRHFPRVLADIQAGIYEALLQAIHAHALAYSTMRPKNAQQLARTSLERAGSDVADALVDVGARLAFLLNLTPFNLPAVWRRFREAKYRHMPQLDYRPLMLDPLELKRRLFAAPFDHVEDPVVARLLRAVVEEYDGLLDMLEARGRNDFLARSVRVFGRPSASTLVLATRILQHYDPETPTRSASVDALELMRRSRERLSVYQKHHPAFPSVVELRNDVAAGIMVHRGAVLIHEDLRVSEVRADALLAHEIDTHVVTYYNGSQQPLRIMALGLAGYEATQEGLAVLAEYLVGGLTPRRFRVLAARVLAVCAMLESASFVDVFEMLHEDHGFSPRDAFDVTVRVFRGGGLTKDALYLRGLCEVVEYLRQNGDLSALFAGKVPVTPSDDLRALRLRGLLLPPEVTPTWLGRRDVERRIERLRGGLSLFDMASHFDSPPDSKVEAP